MTASSEHDDRAWMRRALVLARRGWGQTAPNPMAGAVVVRDGVAAGRGFHARYGEAHAEAAALQDAGERARGATVYVTLEPCNHHGKTPPCVDALIRAGVKRVVAAVRDPGRDSGGGAERLREAGIEVGFGVEETAARELNAPFFFAATGAKRPWVTLKLAMSLDGAIAGAPVAPSALDVPAVAPGAHVSATPPRWLTGEAARRCVHRLRAQSDAIAVGIGTAIADDPLLTVRHGRRPRVAPLRVVIDRAARLPLRSRLVRTARKVPTLVLTERAEASPTSALEAKGVLVEQGPDLPSHLELLHRRGVRSLLVEGGSVIAGALLAAKAVDRLIIFQAPVLLGAGAIPAFSAVGEVTRFTVIERREFGGDLMTVYAPKANYE
ncbi:MAG: bifunctional diaminohydroxyphosphoribosylaminopyrimidine deaminase/5-amino-6-(5-phosphoribosylamino)uracil reductase RibD [Gemmatimonadales bacterium]